MKKLIVFILLLISIIAIPTNVFADEGPKPSIDVTIKNLNTKNYILDLFVYDKENAEKDEGPSVFGDPGLTEDEIQQLYKLNYDGWVSASTRAGRIIFSDCKGNADYHNSFGYFGTPEVYKIVIINFCNNYVNLEELVLPKTMPGQIGDYAFSLSWDTPTNISVIIKGSSSFKFFSM